MSPIEVTASDAPINVSASGTKIDANVSGGQGPQGAAGPAGATGPQGPSGASNWSEIDGKPETFAPSAHSHAIADVTGLADDLSAKVLLAGGPMDAGAALTFSTETTNSEVGGWGFGVGLTGETGQYATIEPAAITIVDPSGTTQLAPGGLTMPNYTKLIVGSFDNMTGGANGIGLICAVGYELNWQGGRLRKVYVGGDGTPQTIYFDSPIWLPAAGVTFSDDTTQTTAGATPGDVSAAQSAAEAYAVQRANHTGSQAISTVDGLQTALDAKATPADVSSAVAALVNSSPAALDTLGELATALGNDANFSTTVTNALAAKAPIASPTFTGTVAGVTKSMVGLGNVDNTADASKPVSTATQTALDGKAALSHTHSALDLTSGTLDIARLPFTVAYPVRAVHVGGQLGFNNWALSAPPTYSTGGSAGDLATLATMSFPATTVAVDVTASVTKFITDNPGATLNYASLEVVLVDAANRVVGWGSTATSSAVGPSNGTAGTSMTVSLLAFPTLNNGWIIGGGSAVGFNSAEITPITAYKLCQSRFLDVDRTDWGNIPNKPTTFAPAAHTQAASTITGLATVATSGAYTDLSGRPTLGTAAAAATTDFVSTSDARLSDARTPSSTLAHASSHASGGTDALSLAGSQITSGSVAVARLPTVLEQTVSGGNTSTAVTLSLASGSVQTWTLNGNCTFTMPTAAAGASLTIFLTQSATNTATFTGVKWSGGIAPTITATANKVDVLVFVSDGTSWYGTALQNF